MGDEVEGLDHDPWAPAIISGGGLDDYDDDGEAWQSNASRAEASFRKAEVEHASVKDEFYRLSHIVAAAKSVSEMGESMKRLSEVAGRLGRVSADPCFTGMTGTGEMKFPKLEPEPIGKDQAEVAMRKIVAHIKQSSNPRAVGGEWLSKLTKAISEAVLDEAEAQEEGGQDE